MNGNKVDRLTSAYVLQEIETVPGADIPLLIRATRFPENDIRVIGAGLLGSSGEESVLAIPWLLDLLNDSNPEVRQNALYSLTQVGQLSRKIEYELVRLTKDRYPDVQEAAYMALNEMGAKSPEFIQACLSGLRISNWAIRDSCAEALGRNSIKNDEAIPYLAAFVKDYYGGRENENEPIFNHAAVALVRVGGSRGVAELISLLKNPDPRLRRDAAVALRSAGADAKPAIPNLAAALKDADEEVRQWAAMALGTMGKHASQAISALEEILEGRGLTTQRSAMWALKAIGIPEALAALKRRGYSLEKISRHPATLFMGEKE